MKTIRRQNLIAAAPVYAVDPSAGLGTGKNPNILVILVDNLGYGELGVYGGGATRGAPTPRIDKLAGE